MKFRAVEKVNPRNVEAERKFYASIVTNGEFTLDNMAEEIVDFTSLSEADVNAVLIAVETVAQKKLADGMIVRLGRLGTLYPTLSSDAEDSAEEVNVKSIKSVGVNYRASDKLLKALKDCTKYKV